MRIRAEEQDECAVVHAVHTSAFPTQAEADLVNAVRAQARPIVSLVAEDNRTIVGHILFSPVSLPGRPHLKIMGLAPMAVIPGFQGTGIGSDLVRAGLDQCRKLGIGAVVVLGHPEYYPRFGFLPAGRFGLRCEYDAPDEAFMAVELDPGCLRDASGTVEYGAAFSSL